MPLTEREFTKIFNENYAKVVLYASRFTDCQAAAEDIAEDTFIKFWGKANSSMEIHSPESYIYSIARNVCISWINDNKKRTARNSKAVTINKDFEITALESMIFAETISKVYSALDKLPIQCKRVCILHFVQGKEIFEIAEELGISVGTVYTHKYRGIALLQKLLNGMSVVLIIEVLKSNGC